MIGRRPLRRWIARAAERLARKLDAAGGGRRWKAASTTPSIAADALGAGRTVRHRARYAATNNAWAAAAVRSLVSSIVGTGIKPRARHPKEGTRTALNLAWEAWQAEADADGRTDAYGLMADAVRGMVTDGEALIRLVPGDGLVPLKLQLIDPDQLDQALTRPLGGGAQIVGGVEFDANGVRRAYWIHPRRPAEPFTFAQQPLRIPATDVIHLYRPLGVGQVRGLSWLAPVLLALKELDEFGDALLVRAKTQTLFAGFIRDADDRAAGFDGERTGSTLEGGMEPGALKVLPPGTTIEFAEPPEGGAGPEFILTMLRAVATGLGVTYEQLTGDMTKVNYSSARVALLEHRRFVEQIQFGILVPQMLAPIWRRFVTTAALAGVVSGDFALRPADWFAVKFVPPGFDWIDPLKDTQAAQLAIQVGLKSRAEIVAERGYDVEEVDREIAEDQARAGRLGLWLGAPAATPAQSPEGVPENA